MENVGHGKGDDDDDEVYDERNQTDQEAIDEMEANAALTRLTREGSNTLLPSYQLQLLNTTTRVKNKKRKASNISELVLSSGIDQLQIETDFAVDKLINSYFENEGNINRTMIIENRIKFMKFMCYKLFSEICEDQNNKTNIDILARLLFDVSEDVTETANWDRIPNENDDPIEIIRPKTKSINLIHARIQPLNWACRRGHVELLRFLINTSPWDNVFEELLGYNKLFLGAIPFGVLSGNIEMVDYLCKDLGMDPNRGPKDWEPVLVVFWEIENWEMILALVRGGASLYHTSKATACPLNHMYIAGWGWDTDHRLEALLTLLFLGVPYYEDQEYSWPAQTIQRSYNAFKAQMTDIRYVVCWNDNYEYVLDYIPKAREQVRLNAITKNAAAATTATVTDVTDATANGADADVAIDATNGVMNVQEAASSTTASSTTSNSDTASNSHLNINDNNNNNNNNQSSSSSSMLIPNNSISSSSSSSSLALLPHTHQQRDVEDSTDDQDIDDDHEDEDEDDVFSTQSDDTYYSDEHFLYDLKRRWMNSVAVLLKRKRLADDQIESIFSMIVPNLKNEKHRKRLSRHSYNFHTTTNNMTSTTSSSSSNNASSGSGNGNNSSNSSNSNENQNGEMQV